MTKTRIHANFEYESISFRSFFDEENNCETHEIGFVFNDGNFGYLQFFLKTDSLRLIELEVKKYANGDLYFSKFA